MRTRSTARAPPPPPHGAAPHDRGGRAESHPAGPPEAARAPPRTMPPPPRPPPLPADVAAVHEGWHRRGRFVTLAEGHRLFVAQEGEGPDLLLVHGFPSTSHDFAAALPLLSGRFRVTLFDQLGFGFSDKPAGAPYSPLDQGRRAGGLARALDIPQAMVVGHDMGLTVAIEMLCRHEAGELGFTMDRLVLCNGSHLVELAHVTQLQKDLMTDEGAAAFVAAFDPERFEMEEHTSELQSPCNLVCRLLLEKKNKRV